MKTYKLQCYHPYWINNEEIVNFNHIETILEQVNIAEPWKEIGSNNYNWLDINSFECFHKLNDNLEYIKIEQNNQTYYYYLIKKDEIGTIDKNGELIVKYYFQLDEWNTYIYDLLHLLLINHCNTHFKRCFLDRLLRVGNKYILNFTLQKYLLDVIPLPNITNKRVYVNGTTPEKIYNLNKTQNSYTWNNLPSNYSLPAWNSERQAITFDVKEWFQGWDGTNINMGKVEDNHRYIYIIANSSAMRVIDDNSNFASNTSQKIMIIPVPKHHADEILHGINDIAITRAQNNCIIVGNQNTISSKVLEALPFTSLFDWFINNQDKASFYYATNTVINLDRSTRDINIPFFLININQPILQNLFDYYNSNGTNGIGKKIRYLVNNLDKLTIDTEPLMFNPLYYYEIYNNGNTQYSISFNDLHIEFDKNAELTTIENENNYWMLKAYFNLFSGFSMSYYFGDNTNIYNTSLDNTNTKTIDVGIPFGFASGASATYLENNLNTGYTGLLNRENERAQSYADMGFDTAILALDVVGNATSSTGWLNPGKTGTNIAKDFVKIAKTITDTVMQQQRADRSFSAGIKNVIKAPSNISTEPFAKASIPIPTYDSNYLMLMYAIIPIEQCAYKVFIDYLHNGYIYDADDDINKFVNRQYMNVLSINTSDRKEDILQIWEKYYENKVFKNKYWLTNALLFLNDKHNFYMTPYLVNCTNPKLPNYVHNTEIEPYLIERIKTPISEIITNTDIKVAPKHKASILNTLIELNSDLSGYAEDIELVCDYTNNLLIINSKADGDLIGQLVIPCFFYTVIMNINGQNYYVDSLNDLCNNELKPSMIIPTENFNVQVYSESESSIVSISLGLASSLTINQLSIIPQVDTAEIPYGDTFIEKHLLVWCKLANQSIKIPDWINRVGDFAFFNTSGNITIDISDAQMRVFAKDNNPEYTFTRNYVDYHSYTTTIINRNQEQLRYMNQTFPVLPNDEFSNFHRIIIEKYVNEQR